MFARNLLLLATILNLSEIIPQTVCEWAIYKPYDLLQQNSSNTSIDGFNKIQVSPIEGNVIIAKVQQKL